MIFLVDAGHLKLLFLFPLNYPKILIEKNQNTVDIGFFDYRVFLTLFAGDRCFFTFIPLLHFCFTLVFFIIGSF